MMDDKKALAILYNYTKGHEVPVPMEDYTVIIPLILNDLFCEEIMRHDYLEQVIRACLKKDPEFGHKIKRAIEQDEEITTRAEGNAMINGILSYETVNGLLCGFANKANQPTIKEAFKLGRLTRNRHLDDILGMLVQNEKKIVFLQAETIGKDIDISAFKNLGQVSYYEHVTDDQVVSLAKEADIIITNKNTIGAAEMDQLPRLALIAEMATGYNNIDIEAARERGIKVCNVSGYSTDAVAQHTLALALALISHTSAYDEYVKSGQYSKNNAFSYFGIPIHEIKGMTWGIVGLGAIGKKVAEIATAMGARVIYYSASGHQQDVSYPMADLDTLLKESDIISIHSPLNDKTSHLFNEEAFKEMKKSAYLINVGRGPIVDEEALATALKDGEIAGAGLDVYEKEPLSQGSKLFDVADRLIMTPHVAWGTLEARRRLIREVYLNIEAFLDGEDRNRVNG